MISSTHTVSSRTSHTSKQRTNPKRLRILTEFNRFKFTSSPRSHVLNALSTRTLWITQNPNKCIPNIRTSQIRTSNSNQIWVIFHKPLLSITKRRQQSGSFPLHHVLIGERNKINSRTLSLTTIFITHLITSIDFRHKTQNTRHIPIIYRLLKLTAHLIRISFLRQNLCKPFSKTTILQFSKFSSKSLTSILMSLLHYHIFIPIISSQTSTGQNTGSNSRNTRSDSRRKKHAKRHTGNTPRHPTSNKIKRQIHSTISRNTRRSRRHHSSSNTSKPVLTTFPLRNPSISHRPPVNARMNINILSLTNLKNQSEVININPSQTSTVIRSKNFHLLNHIASHHLHISLFSRTIHLILPNVLYYNLCLSFETIMIQGTSQIISGQLIKILHTTSFLVSRNRLALGNTRHFRDKSHCVIPLLCKHFSHIKPIHNRIPLGIMSTGQTGFSTHHFFEEIRIRFKLIQILLLIPFYISLPGKSTSISLKIILKSTPTPHIR